MGGSRASTTETEPIADRFAGVRAMAPVTLAYVPFGLLVGSAVGASANPLAAWLATMTIYGGAAHLAVLGVLAQGSGWPAAAAVGLLVNARLIAYATAMAPQWRSAPLRYRAVAALVLTDAPWALSRGRAQDQRRFYLGAALTLFAAWPVLVTLGAMASGWLNGAPVLALLPAVTLGAAVVSQLHQRPAVAAVLAASSCAVLTAAWSAGVSLALSGAVGAIAGLASERAR
jgi:predicted branched-subunit amino acid permease